MLRPDLKIPSKTFLMGEYAVLFGAEAVIVNHAPFFESSLVEDNKGFSFHPESPAGQYLIKTGQNKKIAFKDPHKGAGGFGGSTAELISAFKLAKPQKSLEQLTQFYFDLYKDKKNPPSGGDLVTQFKEKEAVYLFSKNKSKTQAKEISWPFSRIKVLIFKTNIKVKTHQHLESLTSLNLDKLIEYSEAAVKNFQEGEFDLFKHNSLSFKEEQSRLGLLTEKTLEITNKINALKSVAFSRGCGAMGADVVAVFVMKENQEYSLTQIKELNLELKWVTQFG